MQFVIIHGSFGNPNINWFQYLKIELEKLSQKVLAPAFPVDTWDRITQLGKDHASEVQNLENWTKTFEKEVLPKLQTNESICFIGHSLACTFILHMVNSHNTQLDSAIFVSPFLKHLDRAWQIDKVNQTFYKNDFDFKKLQKLIPVSYSVFGDNDPYVPTERSNEFSNAMNSQKIIVKKGQHLNDEAGYKEFPLLLDLCKTRI